jgi:hypothetical protein
MSHRFSAHSFGFTFASWLSLAVSGCVSKKIDALVAPPLEAPPRAENVGPPLTDEEGLHFATQLEEAVRKDPQAAARMLDTEAMIERAATGIGLSQASLKGFLADYTSAARCIGRQVPREIC